MTKELKKRLLPKVKTSITHEGTKVSTQFSVKHKAKFEHQNNLFETINIHMLTIKDKKKNFQSKKKLKKSGIFMNFHVIRNFQSHVLLRDVISVH